MLGCDVFEVELGRLTLGDELHFNWGPLLFHYIHLFHASHPAHIPLQNRILIPKFIGRRSVLRSPKDRRLTFSLKTVVPASDCMHTANPAVRLQPSADLDRALQVSMRPRRELIIDMGKSWRFSADKDASGLARWASGRLRLKNFGGPASAALCQPGGAKTLRWNVPVFGEV